MPITDIVVRFTHDVLLVLAKLAPLCAELEVSHSKREDDPIDNQWRVLCRPLWDQSLEVDVHKPTVLEALREALQDLEAMEAAEQCAADARD